MTTFSSNGAGHRDESARPSPRAIIMLLTAAIFIIIGTAAALAFLSPSTEQDVGETFRYEPGSVTRFAGDNYYLVRLQSGDFLALYDRDTDPDARRRGCRITWRPGESFAGANGVFGGDCTLSLWSSSGELLRGPSPRDMDRLDTEIEEGGSVSVDTGRLICGEGDIPSGGLNSQCLPFRDERSN